MRIITVAAVAAIALAGTTTGNDAIAGDLSFTINGRAVSLPLSTPVQIDEMPATLGDIRYRPNGMQLQWDSTAVLRGGTPTPVFSFTLIGPVTGNDPLEVLGQPVTATADTTLINAALPLQAPLGTDFVAAGLVDSNGSVLASLVERRANPGNNFLLTGPVFAVDMNLQRIQVGNQWVDYAGVGFNNCPSSPPPVGSSVSLRSTAVASFPPGSVLSGVFRADCVELVPQGTAGATGFVQGLIGLVSPGSFELGPLTVTVDGSTQYLFGTVDDLAEGVAVSVDGSYADAMNFSATTVEFVRPVVRFEVPIDPAQTNPGVSISPYGIAVLSTAQVRDEDDILANGLNTPRQVEVRGYLDSSGQAWATRVRDRGNPDPADVRLRGPLQSFADPLLQIQGLTVDTSGATFSDELGNPLTASQFFALLSIDGLVDVNGATYDSMNQQLLGGAIVWIGATPLTPQRGEGTLANVQAGTASNYALPDDLFRNGFENP